MVIQGSSSFPAGWMVLCDQTAAPAEPDVGMRLIFAAVCEGLSNGGDRVVVLYSVRCPSVGSFFAGMLMRPAGCVLARRNFRTLGSARAWVGEQYFRATAPLERARRRARRGNE